MESTGYSRRGSHSYAPKPRGMSLETEQELKVRPVAMATSKSHGDGRKGMYLAIKNGDFVGFFMGFMRIYDGIPSGYD